MKSGVVQTLGLPILVLVGIVAYTYGVKNTASQIETTAGPELIVGALGIAALYLLTL